MRTTLAMPSQPPELWIRIQVRKQDGAPVSLAQLKHYYKRDEASLISMLTAMENQRRVKKVMDGEKLVGWIT